MRSPLLPSPRPDVNIIPAGGRVEDDPLEVRTRFTGLSTINVIIYYVVET